MKKYVNYLVVFAMMLVIISCVVAVIFVDSLDKIVI